MCDAMNEAWQKGLAVFANLREKYRDDSARTADIDLAEAIGLQIKSTCNLLHFYAAREEMFFDKRDNRAALRKIVEDEVANSLAMRKLCERDLRLGYHSRPKDTCSSSQVGRTPGMLAAPFGCRPAEFPHG